MQLIADGGVTASSAVEHSFTVGGVALTVSFASTEIVWFESQPPVLVSLTAVGGTGTTGVRVFVAVLPT